MEVTLEVQAHHDNSLEIRVEGSPGQRPSAQELKAIIKGWAARGGKRQPQAGSHLLGKRHRQTVTTNLSLLERGHGLKTNLTFSAPNSSVSKEE